jgi:DNA mismatch repair protein MSH4
MQLINNVINEDVVYQSAPLDLRNQRTYAVKVKIPYLSYSYFNTDPPLQSGVNGLLDVARQIYKEATEDVHQHIADINRTLIFISILLYSCLISPLQDNTR